jgi:hypothetical protein
MTDRKEVEQHFSRIIEAARAHYEDLKADIPNAANRIEHIRLSTLANSAHKLLTDIELFEIGLVYTRVASISPEEMERYREVINARQKLIGGDPSDVQLDLPEFKSPFTPPGPTH